MFPKGAGGGLCPVMPQIGSSLRSGAELGCNNSVSRLRMSDANDANGSTK